MGSTMRRGEIRVVDFEPGVGSEAGKRRPAVLVSNDAANAVVDRLGHGVVTVVALTSNVEEVGRFQTLLDADATGLRRDSKAQAEQLRSVAIQRVGPVIGRVTRGSMRELDEALRVQLAL